MKKAFWISMAVWIGVLTAGAHALVSGDYTYTDNGDGTCTITDYLGAGGDVTIPDTLNGLTVTVIGNRAFYFCTSLTSIMIPDSVTTIGDEAFGYCNRLASVTIGNNVTSIGVAAFSVCGDLVDITVDSANPAYRSLEGVLYDKTVAEILQYPGGRIGAYAIPDSVISIGKYAFYACSGLTNLTIPDSVTTIGSRAVSGCDGLTNLTIPDSVTSIGSFGISGCNGLTCITIPDSVTLIGACAFTSCYNLTSITIGNSVTTIEYGAFYLCEDLIGIYFKGDPPVLGVDVFKYCDVATAYYLPGTRGWGPTYGGLPTVEWPLSIADVDMNGDVNFADFVMFAGAWGAVSGHPAYDPLCDISDPVDGVIDEADLVVLAENWMITPCP